MGPDFYNFDLGLSRRFHFGHEWSVQFSAQAFNLFNRTNFATVNNVVGANYGLVSGQATNPSGIRGISPSLPLAFTSVDPITGPKREFQLGLRFDF